MKTTHRERTIALELNLRLLLAGVRDSHLERATKIPDSIVQHYQKDTKRLAFLRIPRDNGTDTLVIRRGAPTAVLEAAKRRDVGAALAFPTTAPGDRHALFQARFAGPPDTPPLILFTFPYLEASDTVAVDRYLKDLATRANAALAGYVVQTENDKNLVVRLFEYGMFRASV
jgi:hypothetical protein